MANSIPAADVKVIIFACEAGMGSSLMGVNSLKKKLKKAKVKGIKVIHKPARSVPVNAQVVVAHKGLAKTVRKKAPNAVVIAFNFFLNDPAFDKLVNGLKNNEDIVG